MKRRLFILSLFVFLGALAGSATPAAAQDRLCDPGAESCRDILVRYIDDETQGIDVGFWFMEDATYTAALKRAWLRGVPVRVLMDDRANATYPLNASRLSEIKASCRTDGKCIPMRKRLTNYILHWKTMLFRGQGTVEFSGANYSADAWRPSPGTAPYSNYTDEAIYFTNDPAIFNSFATKFDDHWTNTTEWANYANVVDPLVRLYDTSPKDPSLNFPPAENYRTRSVSAYNAEKRAIDVIMYRITDRAHTDAILNAVARGVPVRLITEPEQYRDVTRMWDAWNVDRLYMGGVQVKMRAHAGLNHQKSVILHDQNGSVAGDQSMVIFGSSNWTSPSAAGQVEHNMFTKKQDMIDWFVQQFERKWNNTGGVIENTDFVPLRPDAPTTPTPADGATGLSTTVTLKWFGGPWAHLYDLYLDTNSAFTNPQVFRDLPEDPARKTETSLFSYVVPVTLTQGTTYYWKVVGKTMALQTKTSATFRFTTGGQAPPPPTTGSAEVVLYAAKATKFGNWEVLQDSTAAGGSRIHNPDLGAAKITTASTNPASYFELPFYAEAGKGYQLWIRGKAQSNNWANDSVYVQFDNSVTSSGAATWRIGTTSATEVNLEDCNGCGLSGWGWQDNGYGNNVAGTRVYFASTGWQTLRVQVREDGISIDQIVLSDATYATSSPGTLKNDTTILAENDGTGTAPPPDPDPQPGSSGDVVMYASEAPIVSGAWGVESDATAAGGAKLRHANANDAKLSAALANPVNFFELTFNAEAGKPYRIWIRGKADSNSWANDSLFMQFDRAVDGSGTPMWRIGSTAAAEYNLEDCSGCGLSNWGWQDNGWGIGVMGPVVYFEATGAQTIRIQTREDGLSVDQVVLSSDAFLSTSPGALKNDAIILQKTSQ